MKYIELNLNDLELSLTDNEPHEGFLISIEKSNSDVLEKSFYGLVYFNVLYPYKEEEDKALGKPKTCYSLVEPDPWLIALAAIM